jgi:hypothetical protein
VIRYVYPYVNRYVFLSGFLGGMLFGWLTYGLARAQDPPASRLECLSTCDEFNRYAIRCGCGNACMFRRDAGADTGPGDAPLDGITK